MDAAILQVIAGIAIPAASIIISTWVAVRLARSERVAAAAARAEERSDDAFVRTLIALSTLNTINLRAESVAEPLRDLRVGLTLLEASSPTPGGDLLSQWFEAERLAGLAQSRESMRKLALAPNPPRTDADVEAIVSAGGPLNEWARDFANELRLWRRSGATDQQLAELIAKARALH